MLNEILRAYRKTQKMSTGETPFHLTYGTKVMIPAEIGCSSHRMVHYTLESNE
jgi:hypothetical protein